MAFCDKCGKKVKGKQSFCGFCGNVIGDLTKCGKCGAKLKAGSKFCPKCGTPSAGGAPSVSFSFSAEKKEPFIAGLLGFIIPGLGHFYLNNTRKAGVLFGALIVLILSGIFILIPVIGTVLGGLLILFHIVLHIFSALDAYYECEGKPIWHY